MALDFARVKSDIQLFSPNPDLGEYLIQMPGQFEGDAAGSFHLTGIRVVSALKDALAFLDQCVVDRLCIASKQMAIALFQQFATWSDAYLQVRRVRAAKRVMNLCTVLSRQVAEHSVFTTSPMLYNSTDAGKLLPDSPAIMKNLVCGMTLRSAQYIDALSRNTLSTIRSVRAKTHHSSV